MIPLCENYSLKLSVAMTQTGWIGGGGKFNILSYYDMINPPLLIFEKGLKLGPSEGIWMWKTTMLKPP